MLGKMSAWASVSTIIGAMKSRPPVILRKWMMETDAKEKTGGGRKKLKQIVSLYFVNTLILQELTVWGWCSFLLRVQLFGYLDSHLDPPPNRQNVAAICFSAGTASVRSVQLSFVRRLWSLELYFIKTDDASGAPPTTNSQYLKRVFKDVLRFSFGIVLSGGSRFLESVGSHEWDDKAMLNSFLFPSRRVIRSFRMVTSLALVFA